MLKLTFVILTLCSVIFAEVVKFQSCSLTTESVCAVHEVRINPCPQAANNNPCKIRRGKSATIEFDVTPEFASAAPKHQAYWAQGSQDIPFAGMVQDACQFMPCPIVKNEKSTLSYSLEVARKFPLGTYPVKWELTNEDGKMCCFITNIRLV